MFPVFWALASSKTTDMYVAIWQKILELAPQILENQIRIVVDYEAAIHSAIHQLIPNAILRGCWFHFLQALLRKWISLQLARAPKNVLWMSMSLALLPAADFAAGLASIEAAANDIANDHPSVLEFIVYLRRQWLPRAHVVSVYRCPTRTNNEVEAFNRQLLERFGGSNRNAFTFLGNNKNIISI